MKECPKCNTFHNKNGIFCSRSCANSRCFSEESRKKKSLALKGKCNTSHLKTESAIKKAVATRKKNAYEKYLSTDFSALGPSNKRRRVLEEQNNCCARCGISEWQGFKICLELEHKDGNNENNDRDNLEALCPNCHSLTSTWRGRNKPGKNGIITVSDSILLEHLKNTSNIRQALLNAGLSAKGKNYERVKKLLME